MGLFCWLQVLQFSVYFFHLQSIILWCSGFARIQKAVVDQTSSRPPDNDHDHFLMQVWLWEVLWNFLVQPLSWSSPFVTYNPLFIAHHNPIKKLLFHKIREDDTSKRHFFFFFGQLMRHPLNELFTFPISFKCWMTVEWLTLSSLATSLVVIRGSTSMMVLNWSL